MARCYRCNACQSMWASENCRSCNYPGEDTRTKEQILESEQSKDEEE